MKGWSRLLGFAAILLYLVYTSAMIAGHRAALYPYSPEPFILGDYARLEIGPDGGIPVSVIAHPGTGQGAPVVVFFMGNAGSLELHRAFLDLHRRAGRGIVALEYPGGGGRPGDPSESDLKANALAAFDEATRLADGAPVFVHGYSLGTGLAVHVARHRRVAGAILDAPFARLCSIMARAAAIPACQLPGIDKWDNLADAALVRAPVLIRHGRLDAVIALADGRALAEALKAAGSLVAFDEYAEGDHGNLLDQPGYGEGMTRFIATARP